MKSHFINRIIEDILTSILRFGGWNKINFI